MSLWTLFTIGHTRSAYSTQRDGAPAFLELINRVFHEITGEKGRQQDGIGNGKAGFIETDDEKFYSATLGEITEWLQTI